MASALMDFANWSTILACSVLKVPQGAAVLAAKSARGISVESLVLELSGFVAGWYVLTLQKWIIDLAMNMSTLVSAASKFAQLQCLWQTRDSGQVSALTWGLAVYTCAILVRFIVMLALNVWVLATVLHYRKPAKKTD
ncbi:hypothetical protein lerEdw1_007505 [Lerista edwardsae]|nr:hypothetical protein lerEdw1_007505 [Lerista edwardsae]